MILHFIFWDRNFAVKTVYMTNLETQGFFLPLISVIAGMLSGM